MTNKKLIYITGPTGIGKTELSIKIAKKLKTEIKRNITKLKDISPEERVDKRIEKFGSMGVYNEA